MNGYRYLNWNPCKAKHFKTTFHTKNKTTSNKTELPSGTKTIGLTCTKQVSTRFYLAAPS